MPEIIIVALIVATAALLAGRFLWRALRNEAAGGCGACRDAAACPTALSRRDACPAGDIEAPSERGIS